MIKDYSAEINILNGLTNELIKVPKLSTKEVLVNMTLNDYFTFLLVKREFQKCDNITIQKSYMKNI